MTPARWEKLEELYQAARALPPSERNALLERADPELRATVAAILAQEGVVENGDASREDGAVLDRPAWEGRESLLKHDGPLQVETPVSVGAQLGPYRIDRKIGQGGMGTVYRATDTRLDRSVAIKVSRSLFDERFEREARAISSLNHPHICTLHDIGPDYMVMELVEGETMAARIRKGALPVGDVLRYGAQIAGALAAAHDKHITHRDLKPANVMIAKNGVKVLDFGLARCSTHDRTLPLTGAVMGTPAYMAPEQREGRECDTRTDIYALGLVLHEMATGKRCLEGEQPSVAQLPEKFAHVIERCLAPDPEDRWQAAADVRSELLWAAKPVLWQKAAEPAPPVVVGRHRMLYRFLAGALLLAAGGVTGWLTHRPSEAEANPIANAKFTRLTDFEGVERDAAISPDGRFVAFLSNRSGPLDIWISQVGTGSAVNLTQGKTGNLDALVRAVGFSGDGSQIWFHEADVTAPLRIVPLMGGAPRVFLASSPVKTPPWNVAWSPDGNRLVYHTADGGDPMFVTDRTGASPHQILIDNPGFHNHYPVWSRDGQWIYFVRGFVTTSHMDLWRISPKGGEPERLTQHNSEVSSPAPLDLRTIVYVARDRDGSGPWLWALDMNRKTTHRISFGLEKYNSVSASADGHRLVATEASPIPSLWSVPILNRVAEERDAKPYPVGTVRALGPRFGGTSLFYLSSRGTGDGLWRFQDGQTTEIWKGSDGALLDPPAVSADRRRVAIALRRSGKLTLE